MSEQLFDSGPAVAAAGYAQVALEQGIDAAASGLTYAVPPELDDLTVGERVLVPLGRGNKPVAGYVVERQETCDLPKVKAILGRDPQQIALPVDLIELARWMAGYYCCPLGMVFATMLPAAVKHGTGLITRTMVDVTAAAEGGQGAEVGSQRSEAGGQKSEVGSQKSDDNPPKPDLRLSEGPDQNPPSTLKLPRLTKLQQAVLDAARQLAEAGRHWVEIKELADHAGARSVSAVQQLVKKGLLHTTVTRAISARQDELTHQALEEAPSKPLPLTTAQQAALDHLTAGLGTGFGVHLLHGVTGSGKTEVYLQLIERVQARARQAENSQPHPGVICLVPEIALTPQTMARFMARFQDVAVLHSGLSPAQRHEQWRRIRQGQARIVVGARSAVFAPLPSLGLILVDEEHDTSYKQDQLPRYHARDAAIKRAQILGIPVVLGSATPSLETYHNCRSVHHGDPSTPTTFGRGSAAPATPTIPGTPEPPSRPRRHYHLIRIPERVPGHRLPQVELVDMIAERRHRRGIHLLSLRLEKELALTLAQKQQAMLLLNRRGYANYIACPDHRCGWMMACEHCDATMVYHRARELPTGGLVRCHHCGAEQLLPQTCPPCGCKVTIFGLGTQRVEAEIEKKFPQARLLRMDSDAMRSGHDYHHSLQRFRQGEVDVLVGTQMIAKGLDFPNVRLVGVISGDTALNLPDFRASERTFQLIAQVAGRAGRSEQAGLVIVQTFSPQDPAIQFASRHDFEGFAQAELALRLEMGLPPVARMARIVVRHRDHLACHEQAVQLARHLERCNQEMGGPVRLRGPMPCPIARIADHHRQQIELLAPSPAPLQRLLTALRNARLLISDAHTAVDVDPVALM